MKSQIEAIKEETAILRASCLQKQHEGKDSFEVVRALSDGVDAIILRLFAEVVGDAARECCMLAVGGYGRNELCPRSDIDLIFVRTPACRSEGIERLVRLLWDGGFQLGHAVRTVEECYHYMVDDLNTANALLEYRYLAGDEGLHGEFRTGAVQRYCKKHRESFVAAKLGLLRESIEGPQRTIYVVEPNLKEGACALRDIQRVLWIENMRHSCGVSFEALARQGRIPVSDVEKLRAAYAFYLRVRCELHFKNNVRQDILERDSVLTIARNLGFGKESDDQGSVERLMGEYYRHARQVYRFARYYLEEGTRKAGLLQKLRKRFSVEEVRPHLRIEDGMLFLSKDPLESGGASGTPLAETILDAFLLAQEKGVRPSEALCEWIRRKLPSTDPTSFQSPEVIRAFRSLLQRGRNVGGLLKILHESEVLGRILPEFGKLTCLVNYDGHHQFTVDEHTLRTLEELDRIDSDPEYPEKDFRRVFEEIKDSFPVRLALLLHDTGKAIPGDHSVSGTEAATLICERLGLDAKTTETVNFLVYHHLELFRVSGLRDFSEAGVIEALAQLVGTEERLKMLYLLTYIDIVSVGPGTWTHWKGAQLAELYQRTLIHLRTGAPATESLDAVLVSAGLDEAERKAVREHCSMMETPAYAREVLPERMLYHLQLVAEFASKREMQVSLENHVGFHDLVFCGADRPRLFADLTGVLFSEGFNVLGARIYSRLDGTVIDIFQVEVADTVQVSVEERVERIRRKLRKIESKKEMVEDFIRQRTLNYRPRRWRKPLFGPSVSFDNESSSISTVIEVSAGDRPGLLYDLAQAIHRLGLDLRTAKVSTLMDRAHDAFYVVEMDGRKVDNPARRSEIAQSLKAHAQTPDAALSR